MNESLRKKIEQRAYEFYLKRGGKHGYHLEDWARAEKEIMGEELGTSAAVSPKPVRESAPKSAYSAKPAAFKKPQSLKRK